ncbi:MAG: LysR substrate-binding domain-containing protein [Candidatus Protistobacter heckmanni]|nr:LysR substrate-binding domain-containing protein [Candidatus Protistobacter heckmanni]
MRGDGQVGQGGFRAGLHPGQRAGAERRALFSDRFYLVCPRAHPLARKKAVSVDNVAAWPFIQLSRARIWTLRSFRGRCRPCWRWSIWRPSPAWSRPASA